MAIKLHASFAVHPGEWLRTELVDAYELSVTIAAERLGSRAGDEQSAQRQCRSVGRNGNPIREGFWRACRNVVADAAAYDLAQARTREKDIKVDRIATAA